MGTDLGLSLVAGFKPKHTGGPWYVVVGWHVAVVGVGVPVAGLGGIGPTVALAGTVAFRSVVVGWLVLGVNALVLVPVRVLVHLAVRAGLS